MGSKETRRIPKHACTGRLVIVALSAQPPGVNELCVYPYYTINGNGFIRTNNKVVICGDSPTPRRYRTRNVAL